MRDWYRLNEVRESWLFLLLDKGDESRLSRWAFGVGNISQLVRTAERSFEEEQTESALLGSLRQELRIDQEDTPLLITTCTDTLAFFRRRLILHQTENQLSFRGFRHVAVDDLIDAHFGKDDTSGNREQSPITQWNRDTSVWSASTADVASLWEIWRDLIPYVPAEKLAGEPL